MDGDAVVESIPAPILEGDFVINRGIEDEYTHMGAEDDIADPLLSLLVSLISSFNSAIVKVILRVSFQRALPKKPRVVKSPEVRLFPKLLSRH